MGFSSMDFCYERSYGDDPLEDGLSLLTPKDSGYTSEVDDLFEQAF
jgi:hypothetical protein